MVSDAGFGETVHNFGYAVDLTVVNFTWFAPDLRTQKSAIRFEGLAPQTAGTFYDARNKIADKLKLFRTTKPGDQGHLQNFDDNSLDSVGSLMALMHSVGPRKMKWKPEYRTPTDYWCDLGLGANLYFVGTSASIWKQDAAKHISAADLANALNAKKQADPKFSVETFLGRRAAPPPAQPRKGDAGVADITAADITAADIKVVQQMLRAEFDAAADNWKLWKPVVYPGSARRPANPAKR